jgi:N6-adenosine-specific RNA methylase IME4
MTVPPTPTQIKQAKRAAKEAALAAKQLALPDRRYGVIVADPPWRWEPYSRETGMDRAAENHYPTSGVEEIAALAVLNIAADDCVLFLWATVPCLEYALMVMKAWGFIYKSQAVWVKNKIGLGYWFQNKHEILLVGTRGHVPGPAPGTQWASVIEVPVGKHSVKPDAALEMIESYYPNLPKIELHRRGARGRDGRAGATKPNERRSVQDTRP